MEVACITAGNMAITKDEGMDRGYRLPSPTIYRQFTPQTTFSLTHCLPVPTPSFQLPPSSPSSRFSCTPLQR